MRYLLAVVFVLGFLFIGNVAFASVIKEKQDLPKPQEVKAETPVPLKAPLSSKEAMDAVVTGITGSFVEVSESDLLLFLNEGEPGVIISDSSSNGCRPDLNVIEPARIGKIILRIL